MSLEVIPAILTDSGDELLEMIRVTEGKVDRVQIDVIDGKFADNRTIFPEVVGEVETNLLLDYHLMVEEPVEWVERCVRGFADRIIGHVEMMRSQVDFIEKVQEAGVGVGLALDLDTSLSELDEVVLPDLDVILLMSVPAGHGGQKFQTQILDKIKELNKLREDNGYGFRICDDGGITVDNVDDVAELGVDEVSVGRALFKGDLSVNIERYGRKSE